MYKIDDTEQLEFEDFYHPFGGKLSSSNRWVKLSKLLPWDKIEQRYSKHFSKKIGAPGKSAQIALGSLIIKERCGFTDEETVEQIIENPYMQYFIGLKEYTKKAPFHPTSMVYFRSRIDLEMLDAINEFIINDDSKKLEETLSKKHDDDNDEKNDDHNDTDSIELSEGEDNEDKSEDKNINRGKLIIDATCTPADIRFPTDISLLNEAREKLEKIIDILHSPLKGSEPKPRTYREKARKEYLKIAKKRRKTRKEIRKGLRKQLGYIKRDLNYISELIPKSSLSLLSNYEYKCLLVIQELYRQQSVMFESRTNRIDNRIVSISQPHVRPIVRGKVSAPTEFGAKISLSLVDGFSRIENLSWETFNESSTLKTEIENYKSRYGFYPESVHVDKIYRTRENRNFCNENNIRMSGPPLGRPLKNRDQDLDIQQEQKDLRERVPIEGKIGEAKRRYSMSRVMTKLSYTSETAIGIIFLVMNLEKKLRLLFAQIIRNLIKKNFWLCSSYVRVF